MAPTPPTPAAAGRSALQQRVRQLIQDVSKAPRQERQAFARQLHAWALSVDGAVAPPPHAQPPPRPTCTLPRAAASVATALVVGFGLLSGGAERSCAVQRDHMRVVGAVGRGFLNGEWEVGGGASWERPRLRAARGGGGDEWEAVRRESRAGGGGRFPAHDSFSRPMDAIASLRSGALGEQHAQPRNSSDFPLVLCVGHGKTATKSLNKALHMLGYHTAHFYGAGVYGLLYGNAAEKRAHDFRFPPEASGRHVDAVLDTPVVDFYNEILLAYPNARVVLTVRPLKSWLKSQQKFYCCYANGCRKWLPPWRRGSNIVFGTECPSPTQAVKRYVQHNRAVVDAVAADRLLVMDIVGGDGWEKLCPFLGKRPDCGGNATFPSRH